MVKKTKDDRTLINGVELVYVSGSLLPFFKLKHKNKEIEKENFRDFEGIFKYMQSHLKGYFTMGTLYNAYQEKKDGEYLKAHPLDHKIVLSDSGGLQQARRGEKFDDKTKREIFTNQAKYSDLAMTFDEMPFKPIEANKQTGVNLMASRCYIREMIEDSAKSSALEIDKQIEIFDEIGTDTVIAPIIHGFRPNPEYFRGLGDNTYLEYAKKLLENIDHAHPNVGGLSFASMTVAADNRIGVLKSLQYIPQTLWSQEIDAHNLENIHLLGLASPQRLMVILSLVRSNLIDPRVKRISFDSTALTKAHVVGRVHKNRAEFKDAGDMRPELTLKDYKDPSAKNVRQYYQNVYNYFKDYDGFLFDSWEDIANHSANNGSKQKMSDQIKENGGEGSTFHMKNLQHVRLCTMYATWCYLEAMEDYIDGVRNSTDFPYGKEMWAIYNSIDNDVKDIETLHEVVEMHYYKVKDNMDFGVDTIAQYESELERRTTHAEKGVQETNVLFEDVDKLHQAHEDQKAFAQQKIDNHNFMRRSKKKHTDEHKTAKEITDSLF
jgi:hypothetical protein